MAETSSNSCNNCSDDDGGGTLLEQVNTWVNERRNGHQRGNENGMKDDESKDMKPIKDSSKDEILASSSSHDASPQTDEEKLPTKSICSDVENPNGKSKSKSNYDMVHTMKQQLQLQRSITERYHSNKREKESHYSNSKKAKKENDSDAALDEVAATLVPQPVRRFTRVVSPGAQAVYPPGFIPNNSTMDDNLLDPSNNNYDDNDTYDNGAVALTDGVDEMTTSPSMVSATGSDGDDTKVLPSKLVDDEQADLEVAIQEKMKERTVTALNVRRTSVKDTESSPLTKNNRRLAVFFCCFLGLAIILSLAIALPIVESKNDAVLSTTDKESTNIPPVDLIPPVLSPLEAIRELLLPYYPDELNENVLFNESSYQYQTMEWLANNDTFINDQFYRDDDETADDRSLLLVERYVVALLYLSTGGQDGYWKSDLSFLTNTSVCEWPEIKDGEDLDLTNGIRCDESTKSVNHVRLDDLGLNGTIITELGILSSLQKLSLERNALTGTIPTQLGNLQQLLYLQVNFNELVGTIPTELTALRKLEYFKAWVNMLTGTIPIGFSKLSDLQDIDLSWNMLSGEIPSFGEGSNVRLHEIWLEGNMFVGTIPDSIYDLAELQTLSLYVNAFSGTLSSGIGQLTDLETIFFEYNSFSGSIPSEIGLCSNLKELWLNDNMFTGTIPGDSIANLDRLLTLYFSDNHFTGRLPSELGLLSQLLWSGFRGNGWTGTIPSEVSSLPALEVLDLGNTNFTTTDYDWFCNKTAMFVDITADCGGEVPEVDCPCCSECCDDTTRECTSNLPVICEMVGLSFAHVNGSNFDERRRTVCECNDEGHTLSCTDTACPSCNSDETVCALNTEYGYKFDDEGDRIAWKNTLSYVTPGLNGTSLYFERFTYGDDSLLGCRASVNGEECRACSFQTCADDFFGFRVECDNVEGAGNVDLCDDNYDDGALTAIGLLDPLILSGCSPHLNFPTYDH